MENEIVVVLLAIGVISVFLVAKDFCDFMWRLDDKDDPKDWFDGPSWKSDGKPYESNKSVGSTDLRFMDKDD